MTIWVKNNKGYNSEIDNPDEIITEEEWELRWKATPEYGVPYYKTLLAQSDYKAIKYSEGLISEEEYAPIRKQRQEWRDRINELKKSE